MTRTILCSCGTVLGSDDEEDLYRLVRAHAVRHQVGTHRPVSQRERSHPPASQSTASTTKRLQWDQEIMDLRTVPVFCEGSTTSGAEEGTITLTLVRTPVPV